MSIKNVDTATLIEKETVKVPVRGLKAIKMNQYNIMMNIKNEQIEKHVSDLVSKFDPPMCINCEKRRADRVCINKVCGPNKYMQVICGKCHSDVHSKAIKKPEIDIEEYFIKLSKFLNEQKYAENTDKAGTIDTDQLATMNQDLQNLRNKLQAMKIKLYYEIENYISPKEMHSGIQDNILKALSLCEHDNISQQLNEIKKRVIFQKNKFLQNDAGQKFNLFNTYFKDLEDYASRAHKKISKSFMGCCQIDLNELELFQTSLCSGTYGLGAFSSKAEDDKITLNGFVSCQGQVYLNYDLDSEKKYRVRFRFGSNPQNYIMIGIMQKQQVNSQWVYGVHNEYFCKRFFNNYPTQECSRIIKGSEMSTLPKSGYEIEMQFDIKNSYMDFADYPKYNNVNANIQHFKLDFKQTYVIAIAIYQSQSISITNFEEISHIQEY